MTIPATTLAVSGVRFEATYAISAPPAEAEARAQAITIEQTIEFPADLIADDDIRRHVIGQIRALQPDRGSTLARISYAVETTGFELPQLLNVVFGNCSLFPGVRLIDLDLPIELLGRFRGPRYGITGLRQLLGVWGRPLLATALKPVGLGSAALAAMARTLAIAGMDVIKDDHGIANQPFALFEERVVACAAAVREANQITGRHAIYLPSLNAPADQLESRARLAKDAGAGGLLVLPGLAGLDTMRRLADDDRLALPIMMHPSFLGSFVADEHAGIRHGLIFGTLARLAGADISIFPSFGGRFSFSPAACLDVAAGCRSPLPGVSAIFPSPGGGMTVDRAAELVDFYGQDTMLLIGGSLHRGDLSENVKRMRVAVGDTGESPAAMQA